MTIPTNPINLFTPFLPATFDLPEEDDRVHDYLGKTFSDFSDVINDKKIGAYTDGVENQNGEDWSYLSTKITRNGFQTMVYIPSWITQTLTFETNPRFPIANIDPNFVITHLWASASLPCTAIGAGDGDYFSFFTEGNARIQFTMSDLQFVITTDGTTAGYSGFIVIEYLRRGFS